MVIVTSVSLRSTFKLINDGGRWGRAGCCGLGFAAINLRRRRTADPGGGADPLAKTIID